jgi:uncharacterized damage-inducible protein DinB
MMKLSDEQYVQPLDYSIGSIQRHMQHTLATEWMWFSAVKGALPDDHSAWLDARIFKTREALRERWWEQETDVRAYLKDVTDEQLNQPFAYDFPWCGAQVNTTWEPLIYIVTHMIDHRAQILQGIHHLGGETVAQDFVQYLWQNK